MTAVLGWIGKGLYAAATGAGYGFRIWEESKDAAVGELVANALSNCTASSCCITGWKAIKESLRPIPQLSGATSVLVPLATYGTGLLIAHTLSKSCNINCCKRASKEEKPTTCQKVAVVTRALLASVGAVLFPLSAVFEQTDINFISTVSGVFKSCIIPNATKCCLSNWEQIVVLEHSSPDLSLISAIALPVYTLFLGIITYQDMAACCKAKSRVDLMPGSATYSPVDTGDEM